MLQYSALPNLQETSIYITLFTYFITQEWIFDLNKKNLKMYWFGLQNVKIENENCAKLKC